MNNSIQAIASESEVSKTVFKALSDKQRARRATDLTNLYREISVKDKTMQEKEFLAVFKKLEDANLGSLIIGRRNKHNRFLWNYNLKQVALAAKGKVKPEDMAPVVVVKKGRGIQKMAAKSSSRPSILRKSLKNQVKTIEKQIQTAAPDVVSIEEKVVPKTSSTKGPTLHFSIELSANTRPQDVQAIIDLANSLNKESK